MPDNISITGVASGRTIATDDIGGVHYQRTKTSIGADGSATDLAFGQGTMAASLPVAIASNQTAVPVSGPATNTELRATPLPVDQAMAGTVAVARATITTSSTQIVAARAGRHRLIVKNTGANPIFIGPTGVTTANGWSLAAGQTLEMETTAALFGVVAASTETAATIEEF
jgi:hypothetical protein